MIRKWIKQFPGLNRIVEQRDRAIMERDLLSVEVNRLRTEVQNLHEKVSELTATSAPGLSLKRRKEYVEPGHFYSPIPSDQDIQEYERDFQTHLIRPIPAIDLHTDEQLSLLKRFGDFYAEMPFSENAPPNYRYYLDNNAFNYMDGLVLYSMLRHIRPSQIIEIGSGYSSCATLDTNQLFFDYQIRCTFIEPYPQLLYSLIKQNDLEKIRVFPQRLQDVNPKIFMDLQQSDILFIDSTHVSRLNSDVNFLFFEILPMLKPGVIVHIHDIYYPFEYPIEWHHEGRVWTETYINRAFLEYNPAFKIIFWGSYLNYFHQDKILQYMPLGVKNAGGSLWLRKE